MENRGKKKGLVHGQPIFSSDGNGKQVRNILSLSSYANRTLNSPCLSRSQYTDGTPLLLSLINRNLMVFSSKNSNLWEVVLSLLGIILRALRCLEGLRLSPLQRLSCDIRDEESNSNMENSRDFRKNFTLMELKDVGLSLWFIRAWVSDKFPGFVPLINQRTYGRSSSHSKISQNWGYRNHEMAPKE
ncbi:hypothetical protein TNIN_474091 [Trichonephila inaurata madagascariensis]|uniref:Uncharacterized protein n=1 Tax=Trichonephila inaurata madagascariensis TaxID=2747483 RepID=A0A8X7BWG5_9ARAC|nr:hypothetical protein TNIN_474091 [Trichonephila inaurata madagascariensis]